MLSLVKLVGGPVDRFSLIEWAWWQVNAFIVNKLATQIQFTVNDAGTLIYVLVLRNWEPFLLCLLDLGSVKALLHNCESLLIKPRLHLVNHVESVRQYGQDNIEKEKRANDGQRNAKEN